MDLLARAVSRLPISWVKLVSRSQYLGPPFRVLFGRLADLFRSGDRVITGGLGKGLRFNAGGTYAGYILGTNDPEVQAALGKLIKPGCVVYDIGANVGFLTVLAARCAGSEGRVVAFEPVPETMRLLRHNVDLNQFANVTPFEVALGDRDGTASFLLADESGLGKLSAYEKPGDSIVTRIEVPVRRLDSLRDEAQLPPPQLVKIDVEGAEVEVLRGADATIRESRPILLIELHGTNTPIAEALTSLGYRGRALGPTASILEAHWAAMVLAAHQDDADGLALVQQIGRDAHHIR